MQQQEEEGRRAANNNSESLIAAASSNVRSAEEEKAAEASLESQIQELEKELSPSLAASNNGSARALGTGPTPIGKSMSERTPAMEDQEESKMGVTTAKFNEDGRSPDVKRSDKLNINKNRSDHISNISTQRASQGQLNNKFTSQRYGAI